MDDTCPDPELCRRLKRHLHGRLYDIWRGAHGAEAQSSHRAYWERTAPLGPHRHLVGPPGEIPAAAELSTLKGKLVDGGADHVEVEAACGLKVNGRTRAEVNAEVERWLDVRLLDEQGGGQ